MQYACNNFFVAFCCVSAKKRVKTITNKNNKRIKWHGGNQMSRLLSTKDVAEKLGVYINTVRAIQKMVGLKESKQRVKKDIFKDEVMVFYK